VAVANVAFPKKVTSEVITSRFTVGSRIRELLNNTDGSLK
jgi:hypothetical protein